MKPGTARVVSVSVVLAALIGTGIILHQRSQKRAASDIIVEPWDRLGGQQWLKPNLRHARLVIPDRPHSLQEVHAWRKGQADTIHRTRTFYIDTNADRMRGAAVGEKQADTVRIVALGDSVTHGWGVTEAESYPVRLETTLRERGYATEVLNAGVPSNPIPTMSDWCVRVAPDLKPDIILWTRRPPMSLRQPFKGYVGTVKQCAKASGAKLVIVLPPVSTFDVHGSDSWANEFAELQKRLQGTDIAIIELTPAFRAAQSGRGEMIEVRGQQLHVIDQETGKEWLQAPRTHRDLPVEIYTLFEQQPEVQEALFYDGGHPDVEGYALMASTIADGIAHLLTPTR